MVRLKPFTKKDTKRLVRVCECVRQHLLGDICCEYQLKPKWDTALASSHTVHSGWYGRIVFYNSFFTELSLWQQIDTIIHEHIHLMMQPLEQAINRMDHLVPKQHRPRFDEQLHVAREITVDRAVATLKKLLDPHIRKLL